MKLHWLIRAHSTYVIKGRYPRSLIDEWEDYDALKGSESISPGQERFSPCYLI